MEIKASFNPLIKPYLTVTIGFTLAISIIGLPLALIWFCGVGQWWSNHYFLKLDCVLSDKSLRFRKGIFVQVEKTIPLENIQDVTFVEGPILRHFNLSILKFETAGASNHHQANMELTGIIDAHEFRAKILEARDKLRNPARTQLTATTNDTATETLATLNRIEALLTALSSDIQNKK
jgi:membrane protein YdbS with pleckstrin-like domain